MKTYQDWLKRYGFALLTLAMTAAAMAIPAIRDGAGTPILVYFFAVLLSAWYGGLGPGLLTTAALVLATSHTLFPFWRIVRLGLGIASGVSISALAEVLHAARRRAERNEQRFRALIEKGWDVISITSTDGVVLYASPTVTRTLGHAPEDLVGRGALEMIHPDDHERVVRLFNELRGEPGASRTRQATIGPWLVDLASHQVTRRPGTAAEGGSPDGAEATLRLTPTEWHILEFLLPRPGQLVGSAQILAGVWGPAFVHRTSYLRFHMARLRRKLEPDPARPRWLITEPGMGYRYQP